MKHTEWMTAISTNRTDYELLSELKRCSIDGIELSVNEWEVCNIDWEGLCENAKRAGVALLSYHLPFGDKSDISGMNAELRQRAIEWHKELIKKASDIGIKRFIIHPSYEPIADDEREARLGLAREGLIALAEYADTLGAVICVEDLPRSCLGHNVEEMQYLVGGDERLRVCFDVNHLLAIYGCTHKDFVDALGDKIVTCHMSDYDFVDEKHFFCGNGDINWDELIGLLESVGYCGPFLYEGGFAPHRVRTDVPFGTFAEARERQMNIRSFKGKQ
ncbi:MAG: sugar phosphate isomerase/epimerase [Clostridia bacterium]|nr:sugar phosphate isomerase/epimerase [Clostridia bacterium]